METVGRGHGDGRTWVYEDIGTGRDMRMGDMGTWGHKRMGGHGEVGTGGQRDKAMGGCGDIERT